MRWLVVVAALLTGCHQWTYHGSRNALGVGPVERPPHRQVRGVEPAEGEDEAPIRVGERVEPDDPGERMVSVGAGPWAAGAVDDDGHGHGILGVELEVLFVDTKYSHVADDFFGFSLVQGMGFDIGFSYYESEARLGPMYFEALSSQNPTIVRLGVGVAWDRDQEQAGPQVTISLFGAFLRGQALFGDDRRGLLMLGFVLEPPFTFIESR